MDLVRSLEKQKTNNPLVSIILLTHDNLDFVKNCFESILRAGYENIEIIIVDNASKDGTSQYLRKIDQRGKIRVIFNGTNLGFAEGNNIGAKYAKGKYLSFLNIDTVVAPNWLSAIISVIDTDKSIGACQSKLLQMNRPGFFDSAGDFIDKYGVMMRRGGDPQEQDRGQYDRSPQIFSARGAALTVRRRLFEKIGGFDTSYFLIYEDIDLCWRIRLSGYTIVLVPDSIVYHHGGFSQAPNRVFFSTRNWLATLLKNYSLSNLFQIAPHTLTIAFCAILAEAVIKRRLRQSLNRMNGVIWIILNFKSLWIKRLRVQSQIRKVSDDEVKMQMLSFDLSVLYFRYMWH